MKLEILVVAADGSEEVETIAPVDLFRRAGIEVTFAGLNTELKLSRGIKVAPDTLLHDVDPEKKFSAVIIPGGTDGVENLAKSEHLEQILLSNRERGSFICSICAGPLVVDKFGLFPENINLTSHPSVKDKLSKYNYKDDSVVHDGVFITSRGAGTAIDFALKIIEILIDSETAEKVSKGIVYNR